MAQCMTMGQAAGLAAARVAERGCPVAEIDFPDLRKNLTAAGAILE